LKLGTNQHVPVGASIDAPTQPEAGVLGRQRAMTATRVASIEHGGDRGNQHTGGKASIDALAQPDAAKRFNVSQRAMTATRVASLGHGGDRRSEDFKAQICAMNQPEAAERFNVSRRTVQYARAVLDDGAPALVAAPGRAFGLWVASDTAERLLARLHGPQRACSPCQFLSARASLTTLSAMGRLTPHF
jgi:hypothetical protein